MIVDTFFHSWALENRDSTNVMNLDRYSSKGTTPSTCEARRRPAPSKGADQLRPHQKHEARDNAGTITIGFSQACPTYKS